MNNKNKWSPISEEVLINDRVRLISDALEKFADYKSYSLLAGNSGIALFWYYYWSFTKKDKYFEKGNALILKSFGFTNTNVKNSLCDGISGFMWVVNHLVSNNFIDGDCNELFYEEEPYLGSSMMEDIKKGNYDYLHNALGLGLYFLSRNNKRSVNYIEALIIELEKIAEKDINGLKWRSTVIQKKNDTKEVYNLSLSHGIASIISFLSKAYKQDILKVKTKELLGGAITFLLSLKSDVPNVHNGAYFPSFISVNENEGDIGSRLAWCYGDLGIGIVLWQAAHILQNTEWEKMAIDILLHTTSRKDQIKENVIDAGICHGSAGIAHIYNRMYQYTGILTFKESAIYWLNVTLEKATFADGLAGYKAWYTPEYGGWKNATGLLEGIAGIGLVLLSATSNIEPKWDECLLLS